MSDNDFSESREPEREEVLDELELRPGRLYSALIYVADDTIRRPKIRIPGLPIKRGPGFAVVQLELVRLLEIVGDDDGNPLYRVRAVISLVEDTPEEVIGREFLITRKQLFKFDDSSFLTYLLEQLDDLYDAGRTRTELQEEIKRLLVEADQDPDE